MKIILSRKGFDSSVGKVASPIFPSGEMCTLPIPQPSERVNATRYQDIRFGNLTLGKLVQDLTRGKIAPAHFAHLDPDLNRESLPRLLGWKPLFGQAGAAEGHLRNVGVQPGDLFLFYGWFRNVELSDDGIYRYVPGARDLHVLFGWLQIERRIRLEVSEPVEDWMRYHPHCQRRFAGYTGDERGSELPQPCSVACHSERSEESYVMRREILRCAQNDMAGLAREASSSRPNKCDSLYVAREHLQLPGVIGERPGADIFRRFHPALCLTDTDPYYSRRVWRMPEWMHPTQDKAALTYHGNPLVWQRWDGYTQLRSAGRGQEFVLDSDDYPQAVEWVAELLTHAGKSRIID